jgi:hypothetical protein
MSVWDDISDDFLNLMEVECEPTLYNAMTHTPSGLDITRLPDTRINGAYSIGFSGVPQAKTDINGYITLTIDVTLKVGFVINSEAKADPNAVTDTPVNDKEDYYNAVRDILHIIKRRLDVSTWVGTLDWVGFVNSTGLIFLNDSENYAYCDITFRVEKQEAI